MLFFITVSETLTSLMYPFEWHHIYVPVLSESLLDYVQAPTPFIQGVPKDLFNLIPRNMLDDVIIVDVDKAKVTNFPANFPVPTMMDVIAEELLKVLWPNEVLFSDLILQEPRKEPTVHSLNTAIRTIFLKHYVSLFHNFRSYINFIK